MSSHSKRWGARQPPPRFDSWARIVEFYGLQGPLSVVLMRCAEVHPIHYHAALTSHERVGPRRADGVPTPDEIMEAEGLSFDEWLRVSQALLELHRLRRALEEAA